LPLVGTKGISSEDLCTDIIWLGPENPRRVLFHSSGVHGVEGYAGSAIQLQYLEEFAAKQIIPEDVAIVFIHAVNPYGMSWYRRWNENNVDLNRNCLSDQLWESYAPGANSEYKDFNEFLNPVEEPYSWALDYWGRSAYYITSYGFTNVKQAVAGGQYIYEKGLFFGGKEIQPSIQNIMRFLIEHFSNVEHYCHIDVHTGLGPKGYDTLLCDGREEEEWIQHLGDHVDRITNATGTAYASKGGFPFGVNYLFANIDGDPGVFSFLNENPETAQHRKSSTRSYNLITQEFGTFPPVNILKILREENMYYHKMKEDFKSHWSKDQFLDSFWIKEPEWEESVLSRGQWLINRAIEFLSLNQK